MNWQAELQEICEKQPLTGKWGTLYTVDGEYVRSASQAEYEESAAERAVFGGMGWIYIRDRNAPTKKCYVIGGPSLGEDWYL
jgi:hypothetical protein